MFTMYEKENLKLYVGTVTGKPRVLNRDGKVVVFTLTDFRGETVDIFFKNRPDSDAKSDMRADRVLNAGVDDGAFLTVLASNSEGNNTATGLDFKFRGRWNFRTDDGKSINILCGTACRVRNPRENMCCITIPVDEFKDGAKTTVWYDVTFFDGSEGDRTWSNATRAMHLLKDTTNPMVVVAGGAITERKANDKVYQSMVGYRITKRA